MAGAGSIIGGRFTLGRRLGAGGMGEVWSAVDREGGACAVKLIRPDVYDDALVPRFRREAQITAALRSDNVVRVIAWGEGDGELFTPEATSDAAAPGPEPREP